MLGMAKLDLGFQTVELLTPEATIPDLSHGRFGLSRGPDDESSQSSSFKVNRLARNDEPQQHSVA